MTHQVSAHRSRARQPRRSWFGGTSSDRLRHDTAGPHSDRPFRFRERAAAGSSRLTSALMIARSDIIRAGAWTGATPESEDTVIRGFKDFLFRGNVLELAIAVVIGVALTAVITAIVTYLIQPIVNVFAGRSANGLGFFIVDSNSKTFVDFGAILSAIINFVIVAAVVYFVLVVPMQRMLAARAARTPQIEQAPPVVSEDVLLLREIRDLLVRQNGVATRTPVD